MNDVLCCIFNHNANEGALAWKRILGGSFDTVILDSGSNPPCPEAVNLPNIYYSGLMNEAYRLLKEKGSRWLVVVTSDIEISADNARRLIDGISRIARSSNVGMYQPSCRWSLRGRALPQSMCHMTGRVRCTNFQEGWFHMVRRDVLDRILPIDLTVNRLGWGVDLALCHSARTAGLLILVDDRVKVLHPKGSGYGHGEAKAQMRNWHSTIEGYVSPRHFRPLKADIRYDEAESDL